MIFGITLGRGVRKMSASLQMWMVIVVYLAGCVAAGLLISRKEKNKSAEEYFTSKNSLPPLAVAFSLVGTTCSGALFMGVPGRAYNVGWPITFAIATVSGLVGIVMVNLFVGKPMRRYSENHDCTTMTAILTDMYKEQRLKYILVPTILLGNLFYAMSQWVAIGQLMVGLMNFDYKTAVVAGVIVTLLYTMIGGNNSNAIVNIFQMFVACAAGLYVVFLALYLSGGFVQLNLKLAAIDRGNVALFNDKFSMWSFLSFSLLYNIGSLGAPASVMKIVQIRDHKLYPKCLFMSVISYLIIASVSIVGLFMMTQTAAGNVPMIESIDTVMPIYLNTFATPMIAGLVVAACLACIMSTGSSLIFTCSSSLVKDVMGDIFHLDCSGEKGVRYGQISVLAMTLISGWLALEPLGPIVDLAAQAWGLMASVITFPLLLGFRWRRATKQGALWGMIAGFLIVIGPFLGLWKHPFELSSGVMGMLASGLVMIVVSLLTEYQEKDYLPPTPAEMKVAMAKMKNV